MKKFAALLLCLLFALTLCACDSQDYKKATSLMQSGDYASAKIIFDKLGDYEDAAQKSKRCTYNMAMLAYNEGSYEEAKEGFSQLGDYEDAAVMCKKCDYYAAKQMIQKGKYEEAYNLFAALGTYEDSAECAKEAKWGMLYQYIEENGTYHEDLEHKVLSMTVESDTDTTKEWIVYIYAEGPDKITIGNRYDVESDGWVILRLFNIDLEKGESKAVWAGSLGVSLLGAYRLDAASGGLRIDTCKKNTSLKPELYSCEIKDVYGKESTTSNISDYPEDTFEKALEEVLTYVPKILKSTNLPIDMKDLGFEAVS